jgi:hypothetical protein
MSNELRKMNEYVQVNYEKQTSQQTSRGNSLEKADSGGKTHSFHIRFFLKPILCFHCRDYVWGEGYVGYACTKCGECIHAKCKLFASSTPCQLNGSFQETDLDSITCSNLVRIENWSIDVVKQWLAVTNLHRYAEVFANYNVNGSQLLNIDVYQLSAFRIRDSFHQRAILKSRDELVFKRMQYQTLNHMYREQENVKANLAKNSYKVEHHHFLLHTFSQLADCSMCKRNLLGIVHQGLLCQKCGLITHRDCSRRGLPHCNPKTQVPIKHHIFGVSLFDLISNESTPSDLNRAKVPLILVKAFEIIEERSRLTHEDLYDVYRLSADSAIIDQLKQQLNENGLELTKLEQLDLNTIAAIVKAFLRDLQDSVIPEEMYAKFIASIQTIQTNDLKAMIKNDLHPLHYNCLHLIMAHLTKVCLYQYKVHGCHYKPDKLFHIFRSILLRPSWERITEIVFNIDKQALVIERLLLECDWGEEMPEYKIKSKRSISELPPDPDSFESVQRASRSIVNSSTKLHSKQQSTESIMEMQWYWGDISRDATALVLKSRPDGSFLVRNSNEKDSKAPYTLCVVKGGLSKSIKIFKQETSSSSLSSSTSSSSQHKTYLYDIDKPCRFESVQALISYYSKISLKEYNHSLDLVLTYGVSKYEFGKTSEWSINKLYNFFKDVINKYEQSTKRCDGLEYEIGLIKEDLNEKNLAHEAFDKIVFIYQQQIQKLNSILNESMIKQTKTMSTTRLLAAQLLPLRFNTQKNELVDEEASSSSEKVINENKVKLEKRIEEYNMKKKVLKNDIEYLNVVMNQLQEELDLIKPDIVELKKKRENYHMWLIQRGETEQKIQNALKSSESMSSLDSINSSTNSVNKSNNVSASVSKESSVDMSDNQLPSLLTSTNSLAEINNSLHSNSLNWFMADCNREHAIELLKYRENGTYLIRPSSNTYAKYVLSLVHANEVKHILINETANGYSIKPSVSSAKKQSLNEEEHKTANTHYVLNSSLDKIFRDTSRPETDSSNEHVCFKTLTELVCYYSKNQIKASNIELDISLLYPVLCEGGNS